MQTKQHILDIANSVLDATGNAVQHAAVHAHQHGGCSIPDAGYISLMGALGCLTVGVLSFTKLPDGKQLQREHDEDENCMQKYVTPEALTFVALISAAMITDKDSRGVITTEFGPHIFFEALNKWEKIYPDKKADDYLAEGMLKATRESSSDYRVSSFDDFLKKRSEAHKSPKSLQ